MTDNGITTAENFLSLTPHLHEGLTACFCTPMCLLTSQRKSTQASMLECGRQKKINHPMYSPDLTLVTIFLQIFEEAFAWSRFKWHIQVDVLSWLEEQDPNIYVAWISSQSTTWHKRNLYNKNVSMSKKVKFSYTRYRPLGPELIPVYRQSDLKPSTRQ